MYKRISKAFLTTLVLQVFTIIAFAQNLTIKGHVTDGDGGPVAGASVTIKKTKFGVATDASGNFSISATKGATLVITAVNHADKEIRIENANILNIILGIATSTALNEVVVIGYGTQRKEAITGSVASISGGKVNEVPAVDISRALQGRIAGVEMAQTSSKPGAGLQIRIRGTRSLTDGLNDPLVVLDGIPFGGSLSDISPSEIKSIDILKDASATAIYGSRGANGVILVTTNKGAAAQKAHLSYNGYEGVKKVWAEYPMMNGPQFWALRKANNATPGASIRTNTIDEQDTTVNTDWQSLLYRTGYVTSHDLGVTGGSEKGSYSIGFGYFKDQGVIPLQYFERYSLRTALDQRIGNAIRIGLNTNTNFSNNYGNNLGPYSTMNLSPTINPRNADGSWKRTVNLNTTGANWAYTKHALDSLGSNYIDLTRAFSSYNSIFGELKIPGITGLAYRINVGLNFRQSNYGNYTGYGVFSATPTTISSATVTNNHSLNWTIENLLTYDRTFARVHKINAVALYSAEQTTSWYSSINATGIQNSDFAFYNIGAVTDPSGQITVSPNPSTPYYAQRGLKSYMARVMYSYDDRYLLSATVRSDGSSVLAPGHQWNTYPAVSAGWNLTKERFMEKFSFINNLKLRVGYGQTSNQAIGPYQTLGALTVSPYNFGPSTYYTGYYVTQLPNPSLGWEFSKTWNYGLDFSLLKNRLSGTVEYYTINTSNVLLNVGLPPTSGVGSYTANIGATQNKGIEFSLNGVIIDNKNGWTWEMGVNVYANRNKLLRLYSGKPYDKGNLWFPGHPIDVIYDYKKIGLMTAADSASGYMKAAEPSGNVGMIKVAYNTKDTSLNFKNGVPSRIIGAGSALDNDDRQIYDIQPDFEGGFNTRVAYKSFDLSIIGYFKNGGLLQSTLYGSSGYLDNLNTRSGNNVNIDYWRPDHTDAYAPRPGGVGGDNPKYGSTLGYFSASYLKVRTITLGYNFNDRWMKKAGIERMRVYFTAENPFVLFSPYNKFSGMDPETNSYADQNSAVSAGPHRLLTIGTNTPSTRNFLVGFNVTF